MGTVKSEDIKEVLFYLDPHIRSSSGGECREQIIKILQEDNGGHLVSCLKKRMKEVMMEMVRKEIKKLSQDQGLSVESMQQRAPSIMKKIMESKQWTDFLSQIRLEMSMCCEEVVEDIRRKGDIVVNKSRVSSQSSVSDSLGSTWNQSNFIFMQPEQLEVLVRSLEEDADHRLTALNTLLSSQLSDVVTGQHWSPIKTGLRTCIKDKDSRYEKLHKKRLFLLTIFILLFQSVCPGSQDSL